MSRIPRSNDGAAQEVGRSALLDAAFCAAAGAERALRQRTPKMHGGAIKNWVVERMRDIGRSYRRRVAYHQLMALNDQTLQDIGISRGHIAAIAEAAAQSKGRFRLAPSRQKSKVCANDNPENAEVRLRVM
jgi:uncharacterized protein YjiS (DUF1127 family)